MVNIMFLKAVLSKKNLTLHEEYMSYTKDILMNKDVMQLKNYKHHLVTSRFQHSLNVSYYNFLLCKLLHMNAKSAARAGLLHDLYFYNKKTKPKCGFHLTKHPQIALANAMQHFTLTKMEIDMISTHMWPITNHMPHYKETIVICMIDKMCAIMEIINGSWIISKNKVYSHNT